MKVTDHGSAGAECTQTQNDGEPTAEQLSAALEQTPRGAFALAALTTGSLLLAWLLMYFLIFVPRGTVG